MEKHLFEDVVTTEQSAITAADILSNNGFEVAGIVAIVDRQPISRRTRLLGPYQYRRLVDFEELTKE